MPSNQGLTAVGFSSTATQTALSGFIWPRTRHATGQILTRSHGEPVIVSCLDMATIHIFNETRNDVSRDGGTKSSTILPRGTETGSVAVTRYNIVGDMITSQDIAAQF